MKYPCIESTLEAIVGNLEIRLWINRKALEPSQEEYESTSKVADLLGTLGSVLTGNVIQDQIKVIEKFQAVAGMNAIHVRQVGNPSVGIVVYLVDFNDNHG